MKLFWGGGADNESGGITSEQKNEVVRYGPQVKILRIR